MLHREDLFNEYVQGWSEHQPREDRIQKKVLRSHNSDFEGLGFRVRAFLPPT